MSDDIIHLDFESFSKIDIKKCGGFRYAADDSTEILMAAVALNDEDPVLWLPEWYETESLQSDPRALEIMKMWADHSVHVYAHNSSFEFAICKYHMKSQMGLTPPDSAQWRCTAAMARRAAIPSSLEDCAKILKLAEQKDNKGARLITKFCKLGKKKGKMVRTMPWDAPEAFEEFAEYCLQDVRTERDIHKRLKPFELTGMALRTFQLDLKINDNGVPVDRPTLIKADKLIDETVLELTEKFTAITGLTPTQNKAMGAWFRARGYEHQSMDAEHIGKALADAGWADCSETLDALKIRKRLGFAAVKKVKAMLRSADKDNRVRGSLVYYGAERTGRSAGRLIQPQNFKRPSFKDTAGAYEMIKWGCSRDDLSLMYGDTFEVIASCIRHFVQFDGGQQILDADYASIEARIVCWLAGQQDALDEFVNGDDAYIKMALKIFPDANEADLIRRKNNDESTIERFVGKQSVLGCGFGMGVEKFLGTCESYGQTLDRELGQRAIDAYRSKYDKVKNLWYLCNNAAMNAIRHPGRRFKAGPKLSFCYVTLSQIPFLTMRLPSGRNLVYAFAAITDTGKFGPEVSFLAKNGTSGRWVRSGTYGGSLVENATQATAGDIMANGAIKANDAGFEIVTLVHDQALGCQDLPNGKNIDTFCDLLADLPAWADGLPVIAEGKVTPYYVK
jgi:DNA polymerase